MILQPLSLGKYWKLFSATLKASRICHLHVIICKLCLRKIPRFGRSIHSKISQFITLNIGLQHQSIVNEEGWLESPANIKGANKDAKI